MSKVSSLSLKKEFLLMKLWTPTLSGDVFNTVQSAPLYLWIPNKEEIDTEVLTKNLSDDLINGIIK